MRGRRARGSQPVPAMEKKMGDPQEAKQPALDAPSEKEPVAPVSVTVPAEEETDAQDAGLASNGSLSDSEVMDLLASPEAVAEEKRLQHEREEQEGTSKTHAPSLLSATLDKDRFAALNHLLAQSEAYSSFLETQMKDIEASLDQKAAKRAEAAIIESTSDAKPTKAGSKRGRGKASEEAIKKVKSSLTPTQQFLPLIQADMRDYQIRGVKWLIALYQNGVNGILADQMGLGKTLQTIGFLSHLKSMGNNGPYMVIGPLSTLSNWVNEFKRFFPSQPVLLYHGSKAEREQLRETRLKYRGDRPPADFPVLVTSYEIIIADARALAKIKFKYVVVDEGHRLKNAHCRLLRELRTIPVENKLLLSGTPLQNNLAELWSLLNFLMPDVFKDMVDFEEWFKFADVVGQEGADEAILAAEQRNNVVSKLHAILKPFMLRRLKSDVKIDLPSKMEIILYAPMTSTQKELIGQLKEGTLMKAMADKAEQEGGSIAAAGKLNNVLMQMRKICNHPDLITSAFTSDISYPTPEVLAEQCGKMRQLDRLLEVLHKRGHKVLIFSQMVKMLDIIDSYAEQRGHRALRLDGQIPWQQRQANIESFNKESESWLFLLSTRAGGLGINLTAADTVIIYDSDWNPHQDLQAMDRCHRIGQTKPVLVFRLATSHSVEGKMLKRAADKMALERLVIKKGAFQGATDSKQDESDKAISLSASELMELLQGNYLMGDIAQSDAVSDETLNQLLDRTHLSKGTAMPYPMSGVGYEVVQGGQATSILHDLNK